MRLLYMGSPTEVISPLQTLLNHCQNSEDELLGVVSQPAKPSGRKNILTDPPLAAFAKSINLPTWQPEKASRLEFLNTLKELSPDVIITAAYGQILSDAFLAIPKRATINIHPSLLPKYRGAIPVPAALLDGCTETGVSILFTVKALDAGAIILQEKFAIAAEETSEKLTERLFAASGPLLIQALDKLRDHNFKGEAQDEARVTHCKKIVKEDGAVDWQKPASQIVNEFRAYQPWPGSYTFKEELRISLEALTLSKESQNLAPGEFVLNKARNSLIAGTGSGSVEILQLKPAGAKSLRAIDFWNGQRLQGSGRFKTREAQ